MNDTLLSAKSQTEQQASWRDVHFASLIIFIVTAPLTAAFFVYSTENRFMYTVAMIAVGLVLSASGSRWLTVFVCGSVLSPVLGLIVLTEVMMLLGRFIRL